MVRQIGGDPEGSKLDPLRDFAAGAVILFPDGCAKSN